MYIHINKLFVVYISLTLNGDLPKIILTKTSCADTCISPTVHQFSLLLGDVSISPVYFQLLTFQSRGV